MNCFQCGTELIGRECTKCGFSFTKNSVIIPYVLNESDACKVSVRLKTYSYVELKKNYENLEKTYDDLKRKHEELKLAYEKLKNTCDIHESDVCELKNEKQPEHIKGLFDDIDTDELLALMIQDAELMYDDNLELID